MRELEAARTELAAANSQPINARSSIRRQQAVALVDGIVREKITATPDPAEALIDELCSLSRRAISSLYYLSNVSKVKTVCRETEQTISLMWIAIAAAEKHQEARHA